MAVQTLGTNLNNSLATAKAFNPSVSDADFASLAQAILDDLNPASPIEPGAFSQNGLLFVPRRGVLRVLAGDWVGVDSTGWPILVSANAIANGPWHHT